MASITLSSIRTQVRQRPDIEDSNFITDAELTNWINESIAGWREDGWLGSTLTNLRPEKINSTTVAFKVQWLDVYEGGEEYLSCGWYVAYFDGERWAFTQYGEIDCAEHGF